MKKIKNILKWFINKIGVKIILLKKETKSDKIDFKTEFDLGEEFSKYYSIIRPNTMVSTARMVTLYQQAVFCEKQHIEGAFVECGVWKGGLVGVMALANLKYGNKLRPIHLFDAFDDICEPDEKIDGQRAIDDVKKSYGKNGNFTGKLNPLKGFYDSHGGAGTLEDNKFLLETKIGYDSKYLFYHKGWFQDTLPDKSDMIENIAILRLDGDWYASIKICLEHLYTKVVSGGFVIIDDYGYYDGCTRAIDEFIEENSINCFMNHIDYGGRYWIKS
jgi:hypothetical protein